MLDYIMWNSIQMKMRWAQQQHSDSKMQKKSEWRCWVVPKQNYKIYSKCVFGENEFRVFFFLVCLSSQSVQWQLEWFLTKSSDIGIEMPSSYFKYITRIHYSSPSTTQCSFVYFVVTYIVDWRQNLCTFRTIAIKRRPVTSRRQWSHSLPPNKQHLIWWWSSPVDTAYYL